MERSLRSATHGGFMHGHAFAVLAAALLLAAGCSGEKADCVGDAQVCGGACVSLATDNANCGACGNGCGPGTACSNRVCIATCTVQLPPPVVTPGDATLVTAEGSTTARSLASRFSDTLNVKDFGAAGDGVTDDTAAINAAICAGAAAGGATIHFPVGTYLVTGQLTVPFEGTPPLQKPIHLRGVGAHFPGGAAGLGANGPRGGSVIDLRYAGRYGKILTLGHGLLEIDGLTFVDGAGTTTAFIYTTNTTLHIHGNGFFGSKTGTLCDQDVIVLGGTVERFGEADPTHGFQGYGTVIERNYFDRIRRAVWLRTFANGVVIQGNTIWANSGSGLENGAAIELQGSSGAGMTGGNYVAGNIIEMMNYPYAFKCAYASFNTFVGNGAYDETATTLGVIHYGDHTMGNLLVNTLHSPALPVSNRAGSFSYNSSLFGAEPLKLGFQLLGAPGNALSLYAGQTNDHVYAEFYPRTQDPMTRGGTVGFSAAASPVMSMVSEIGPLHLGSATYIASLKPHLLPEAAIAPAVGTFTLDASSVQVAQVDLATAGGTWALTLSGGYGSALVTITIRNTSAGAVTLSWPANVHLAGAWVNPGPGANRSITLRRGDAWYEVSRTAADVAN